jgi:hypothetical protein
VVAALAASAAGDRGDSRCSTGDDEDLAREQKGRLVRASGTASDAQSRSRRALASREQMAEGLGWSLTAKWSWTMGGRSAAGGGGHSGMRMARQRN